MSPPATPPSRRSGIGVGRGFGDALTLYAFLPKRTSRCPRREESSTRGLGCRQRTRSGKVERVTDRSSPDHDGTHYLKGRDELELLAGIRAVRVPPATRETDAGTTRVNERGGGTVAAGCKIEEELRDIMMSCIAQETEKDSRDPLRTLVVACRHERAERRVVTATSSSSGTEHGGQSTRRG
jgi:hypothetical protein